MTRTPCACCRNWGQRQAGDQPLRRHGADRRRPLGHDGVVRQLIAAGAPLDHVNNLHWTALIESIVLGKLWPAPPGHAASTAHKEASHALDRPAELFTPPL